MNYSRLDADIVLWVMSHINASFVTQWVSHHMCDITRTTQSWCVSHCTVHHDDTFRHVKYFCCIWRTHSYVTWLTVLWHDSQYCDMTHSTVTWLTVLCIIMTRFDMWNIPVLNEWLIHTWHGRDSQYRDMTHSTVYHNDSFRHVKYSCSIWRTHSYVTWLAVPWHDSQYCVS